MRKCLSVGLCHTFQLILLLDGVRVRRTLQSNIYFLILHRNSVKYSDELLAEDIFSLNLGRPQYLSGIDQLISKAFSDALDVPEGRLAGSSTQQPNSLVDATQWGHVNSLTSDGTGTSDTGGVLTGSAVDDGVDQHL